MFFRGVGACCCAVRLAVRAVRYLLLGFPARVVSRAVGEEMGDVEILDVERGDGFVDERADDLCGGVFGFVSDLGGGGVDGSCTGADSGVDGTCTVTDGGTDSRSQVAYGAADVAGESTTLYGHRGFGIAQLRSNVAGNYGFEVVKTLFHNLLFQVVVFTSKVMMPSGWVLRALSSPNTEIREMVTKSS